MKSKWVVQDRMGFVVAGPFDRWGDAWDSVEVYRARYPIDGFRVVCEKP